MDHKKRNAVCSGFLAVAVVVGITVGLEAQSARADDVPEQHLSIKNHAFVPAEVDIPTGQKIKLIVKNEDSTPSEFESFELNREKIVPPGGEVPVFIGPLDAGAYPFFDDFHRDTTNGKVVAK
jgi:hypothetical protein